MAEEKESKIPLETWLFVGITVTILLSTILIVIVSANKNPVYSAYISDAEGDYQYQQINLMADDLGPDGAGYTVANTMSTPMLVNDWREPHRTLLVMVSPEKPFDDAEATAIHEFVTQHGGKVILASDSSNAKRVADKFGVSYFTAPVLDDLNHYQTHAPGEPNEKQSTDIRNVWALASVNTDVRDMNAAARSIGCTNEMLATSGSPLSVMHECRSPVLFRQTTAMQILQAEDPVYSEQSRNAYVLAHASTSSFLDELGTASLDTGNGQLGEGETSLIIRIDYPNIKTTDKVLGEREGEISVTGSIVFVSNDDVFANFLWDRDTAERTGHPDYCVEEFYSDTKATCWNGGADGLNPSTDTTWKGNSAFFSALISDMMEHDNEEITNTVRLFNDEFYIVFDESRHVTGSLSAPFTEAMGAIVLLTSDVWLKWLIVLNLLALLSIAIMVVPEKENWRHIFDLTRFRERPTKIDPSKFQMRVREALVNKVRIFYDLTRDQMVLKTPAEVLSMIRDPRLVELAQSQSRNYDEAELRELMQMIRRWGK